ncbi:MAG: hypothetical protein ABI341_04255 [Nitrososphaera sp.]|jgi:hypothetical protein
MKPNAIMDRALQVEWLTAALEVAGVRDRGLLDGRTILALWLRDRVHLAGHGDKRITILSRIWIEPPASARQVVEWGRQMRGHLADSRVLHVGAMMATYAFFRSVCAATGREFFHGEDAAIAAVRRRVRAEWGDRVEIDVATRAVIRTLRNLGLVHGKPGGRRIHPGTRLEVSPQFAPWIVHALLVSRGVSEIDEGEARSAPELFMVALPTHWDRSYPHLERYTEGDGRIVFRIGGLFGLTTSVVSASSVEATPVEAPA